MIPNFVFYAFASLIGVFSYFLSWIIQQKIPSAKIIRSLFSMIGFALGVLTLGFLFLCLPIILLSSGLQCIVEGNHEKSSDYFWVVFIANVVAFGFIGFFLSQFPSFRNTDEFVLNFLLTALATLYITPTIFQIYKNFARKSDTDKHFDE